LIAFTIKYGVEGKNGNYRGKAKDSYLVDSEKLNFHLISLVIVHKMCYQNCRLFGINLPKPCNF